MKKESPAGVKSMAFRSVSRASNILSSLSDGTSTVTEIANRCELDKSTASRLLKALEQSNLVIQDPISHRYYLGTLIVKIASSLTIAHSHLVHQTVDTLKRLSEVSEETALLSILVGIQYVHLNEVVSKHEMKITLSEITGIIWPPIKGVMGATFKVLLSQLDEKSLKAVFKKSSNGGQLQDSIIEEKVILEQLQQIRKQGYYLSFGEKYIGEMGLAAPIKNYMLPAALTIVGPELRLKPKVDSLVKDLKTSAEKISHELAGNLQI
jgi:IclR family transcriptional regulator, KDG regulon repressor